MNRTQKILSYVAVALGGGLLASLMFLAQPAKYGASPIGQNWLATTSGGGPAATTTEFIGSAVPNVNMLYDLGIAAKKWRNLFLSGDIYAGTVHMDSCVGTGCLVASSTAVGSLPQVLAVGNVATNTVQFGGGTSTGDFYALANLWFKSSSGTMVTSTYGYFNNLSVNGVSITGSGGLTTVPQLQAVLGAGSTTTNPLYSSSTGQFSGLLTFAQSTGTSVTSTYAYLNNLWVNGVQITTNGGGGGLTTVPQLQAVLNAGTTTTKPIYSSSTGQFDGGLTVGGVNVCLSTGVNCPSGGIASSQLDSVLIAGNTTTHPIYSSSTGQFSGLFTFAQSTGTSVTSTYGWFNSLTVNGVSITGNGGSGATPQLQAVLAAGSTTTNPIYSSSVGMFASVTTTNQSAFQGGVSTTQITLNDGLLYPSMGIKFQDGGAFGTVAGQPALYASNGNMIQLWFATGTEIWGNLYPGSATNGYDLGVNPALGGGNDWAHIYGRYVSSSAQLTFAYASGSSMEASAITQNGVSVCLSNGTNCQAAITKASQLDAVLTSGSTTTHPIYSSSTAQFDGLFTFSQSTGTSVSSTYGYFNNLYANGVLITGNGGSGATPQLQAVLAAGSTTTLPFYSSSTGEFSGLFTFAQSTGTSVTSTYGWFNNLAVNGSAVCLANGTNCPSSSLGNSATTTNLYIAAGGSMKCGGANCRKFVPLSSAGAWPSITNGAVFSSQVQMASNTNNFIWPQFATSGVKYVEWTIQLAPTYDGAAFDAVIDVASTMNGTGSIDMGIQGGCTTTGGSLDMPFSTAVTSSIGFNASNTLMSGSKLSFTPTNASASSTCSIRVGRWGDDPTDTFSTTSTLVGVRMTYGVNQPSDSSF